VLSAPWALAFHISWRSSSFLSESFLEWIHEPGLFRSLADSPVLMRFIAAAEDIRPGWPLRQLAEIARSAVLRESPRFHGGVYWAAHIYRSVELAYRNKRC
jgi:hypothetical protein